MGKDDSVSTFFSKIAQTKAQLIAIGVPVDDDGLVQTAFDGLVIPIFLGITRRSCLEAHMS
jgi:hypothetical protein